MITGPEFYITRIILHREIRQIVVLETFMGNIVFNLWSFVREILIKPFVSYALASAPSARALTSTPNARGPPERT